MRHIKIYLLDKRTPIDVQMVNQPVQIHMYLLGTMLMNKNTTTQIHQKVLYLQNHLMTRHFTLTRTRLCLPPEIRIWEMMFLIHLNLITILHTNTLVESLKLKAARVITIIGVTLFIWLLRLLSNEINCALRLLKLYLQYLCFH